MTARRIPGRRIFSARANRPFPACARRSRPNGTSRRPGGPRLFPGPGGERSCWAACSTNLLRMRQFVSLSSTTSTERPNDRQPNAERFRSVPRRPLRVGPLKWNVLRGRPPFDGNMASHQIDSQKKSPGQPAPLNRRRIDMSPARHLKDDLLFLRWDADARVARRSAAPLRDRPTTRATRPSSSRSR